MECLDARRQSAAEGKRALNGPAWVIASGHFRMEFVELVGLQFSFISDNKSARHFLFANNKPIEEEWSTEIRTTIQIFYTNKIDHTLFLQIANPTIKPKMFITSEYRFRKNETKSGNKYV